MKTGLKRHTWMSHISRDKTYCKTKTSLNWALPSWGVDFLNFGGGGGGEVVLPTQPHSPPEILSNSPACLSQPLQLQWGRDLAALRSVLFPRNWQLQGPSSCRGGERNIEGSGGGDLPCTGRGGVGV